MPLGKRGFQTWWRQRRSHRSEPPPGPSAGMQWGAGGDSASLVIWKPSGSPAVTHNAFVPGFLARRAGKETEMGRAGLTLLKRDRQVFEQGAHPHSNPELRSTIAPPSTSPLFSLSSSFCLFFLYSFLLSFLSTTIAFLKMGKCDSNKQNGHGLGCHAGREKVKQKC